MKLSRRSFVKTGLLYVPTLFTCPGFGATRLGLLEPEIAHWAFSRLPNLTGDGKSTFSGRAIHANDYLMKGWKRFGLRAKIKRANTYVGRNITDVRVPVINDLGTDTTDALSNFVEADFSETVGLTGSTTGSAKAVITRFDPIVHATINDFHMAFYTMTTGAEAHTHMRVHGGGATDDLSLLVDYGSGQSYFSCCSESAYSIGADTNGSGYYIGTRTASNSQVLYRNGVAIGTQTSPGGSFPSGAGSHEIFVHAGNAFVQDPSGKTFGGYHIGTGFTATDAANGYYVMQIYQTMMARAVP